MGLVNNFFDKIYFINMDKDVARLEHMVSELQNQNISDIIRITGEVVDTPLDQIPENVYRNFNRKDEKYVLGQLGCRLSHLSAIAHAKENNYKRILILEDDIVFLKNINDLILANFNNIENSDVIYFGGLQEQLFRNQIVLAHCYGLSIDVYDDILNMAIPSGMEIDNFYAKVLQHMSVNSRPGGQYVVKTVEPFNSIIQDRQSFVSNII